MTSCQSLPVILPAFPVQNVSIKGELFYNSTFCIEGQAGDLWWESSTSASLTIDDRAQVFIDGSLVLDQMFSSEGVPPSPKGPFKLATLQSGKNYQIEIRYMDVFGALKSADETRLVLR